jgi:hypothetical protein
MKKINQHFIVLENLLFEETNDVLDIKFMNFLSFDALQNFSQSPKN